MEQATDHKARLLYLKSLFLARAIAKISPAKISLTLRLCNPIDL
jgi:hypothetical protein